jgi:hypothetical protein
MRIRDHLQTRIALALAAATVVSATAATVATASGATGEAVPVKLVGAPVLIDSGGTSGKTHGFWVLERLFNSSKTPKTVQIKFDAVYGSKVVDSHVSKNEIGPGDGLAVWYLDGPADMKTARAHIVDVEGPIRYVAARKILGKGKFHKDQNGCWMTAPVQNVRAKPLSWTDELKIYYIALRGGKIVAFGAQSAEDDKLAPHAKGQGESSLAECVTGIDEVRAYAEVGM